MKKRQSSEIDELIQKSNLYNNEFYVLHHWRTDLITKVKKYNGSSFISKKFINWEIAHDICFMDDTCCINIFDFPLITITFEDFNEKRQILAFGFLAGRGEEYFVSFLNDVKEKLKKDIRIFIVDRWMGQKNAISIVFNNSTIVFCRIHLERNIRTTFGEYSQVGSLLHQLFKGTISKDKYLNELQKLIDSSKKHKRALKTLYSDVDSYCPSKLNDLQLRKHTTTNAQEGLFGTLKVRYGNDRLPLSDILTGIIGLYNAGFVNSIKTPPQSFKTMIYRGIHKSLDITF